MEKRAGLIILYIGLFAALVAVVPLMRFIYFFITGSEDARLLPLLVFLSLLTLAVLLVLGGCILRVLARQGEAIRRLQVKDGQSRS